MEHENKWIDVVLSPLDRVKNEFSTCLLHIRKCVENAATAIERERARKIVISTNELAQYHAIIVDLLMILQSEISTSRLSEIGATVKIHMIKDLLKISEE